MQRCCKCGVVLSNQPYQITKWGQLKDSKWSRHKIETFRGARDFFGPINGTSNSKGHFGAKKNRKQSKILNSKVQNFAQLCVGF